VRVNRTRIPVLIVYGTVAVNAFLMTSMDVTRGSKKGCKRGILMLGSTPRPNPNFRCAQSLLQFI